jgi:hypothetical protein
MSHLDNICRVADRGVFSRLPAFLQSAEVTVRASKHRRLSNLAFQIIAGNELRHSDDGRYR